MDQTVDGRSKQLKKRKKTRRNLKAIEKVKKKASIHHALIAKRGTIQKNFVGSNQEFNAEHVNNLVHILTTVLPNSLVNGSDSEIE